MAMSPTFAPCAATPSATAQSVAATAAPRAKRRSEEEGVMEVSGSGRYARRLEVEAQLGVISPLRVGMEGPVAVVVDVVDAERCAPLAVEAVLQAHVGNQERTEAGECEAVRVRVVELPVLSARVANAGAARPVLV